MLLPYNWHGEPVIHNTYVPPVNFEDVGGSPLTNTCESFSR